MKITRRKLFGSLLGLLALPVAAKAAAPKIVHATDPGAEKLEAYDPETGYVPERVQSVCVGKWIEQIQRGRNNCVIWYNNGVDWGGSARLVTLRIPGNWQVRPKTPSTPLKKKELFGCTNTSAPFPYPVVHSKLG